MVNRLAALCGVGVNSLPNRHIRVIGINLGTTNSTIAQMVWDVSTGILSDTECLPIKQRTLEGGKTSVLFPSVVAIYNNRMWVGAGARKLRSSRVGSELRDNVSYFAETKNDMGIRRTYRAPAGFGSARAIASHILRELAERAAQADAVPITNTVITVPASFQFAQRHDTVDAAQRANIEIQSGELLDEPVAAFLDYIFHAPSDSLKTLAPGEVRNLLVFDFGGGTCDVAVFRISKSEQGGFAIIPASVSRYCRLGGGDIDRAIVADVLLKQFVSQHAIEELSYEVTNRVAFPALLPLAKALKEKMSVEMAQLKRQGRFELVRGELQQTLPGTYPVHLPGRALLIASPRMTATDFEAVLEPFLDTDLLQPRGDECKVSSSIFAPITDALERADLSKDQIDFCLLAGGGSLIPQVQKALGDFFSKAELLTFPSNEDAQTAVAKGAALHAMAMALFGKGVVQLICHDDISFQTQSGPVLLVPRGTPLPYPPVGYARNNKFRCPETRMDGRLPVRVSLVAGQESRPLFSSVWNIPAPVKEGTGLWLEYRCDENQCLELRMGRSGEAQPCFEKQIENPLTHVVDPIRTRGQIEEMEEQLRTNDVLEEDTPNHLEKIGELYWSLGQREKAMAYFRWTLWKLHAPTVDLLNKMAACAREQKNRKATEKFYEEAARLSDWSGTFFNWALAKESWGDLDAALHLVKHAHELEGNAAYLVLQARLEKKLGNREGCDRLLTEAIAQFGPPSELDDWSLSCLSTAASMAGSTGLLGEIQKIRRDRRLQGVAAPSVDFTLGYDDTCKEDEEPKRGAAWAG